MKTYVVFYGRLKNDSYLIHCMLMRVEIISNEVLNRYKNTFCLKKNPRSFFLCLHVFCIILN